MSIGYNRKGAKYHTPEHIRRYRRERYRILKEEKEEQRNEQILD